MWKITQLLLSGSLLLLTATASEAQTADKTNPLSRFAGIWVLDLEAADGANAVVLRRQVVVKAPSAAGIDLAYSDLKPIVVNGETFAGIVLSFKLKFDDAAGQYVFDGLVNLPRELKTTAGLSQYAKRVAGVRLKEAGPSSFEGNASIPLDGVTATASVSLTTAADGSHVLSFSVKRPDDTPALTSRVRLTILPPDQIVATCDAVDAAPEMFVGKPVVFHGSVTKTNIGVVLGKQDLWETWACKDQAGENVARGIFNVQFNVQSSESTRTPSAEKANSRTELFRVSGVVKATPAGLPMFLEKATIELARDVK